ncbi:hypothetical protein [Cellulomonas sp. URHE0023]|uniref:hypothetical protein n=1 Tax=Cellulomonas sp. URHE0023 TaxID=1380354 RepID=UPI0012DC01C0|nr:hypothetical protein [Cellulomonas sp. URHE0023]
MPAPSRTRLLRATAVLVGLGGLLLVILAAVEGYQTGVSADEQGTVGQITALEVGSVLVGGALVVVAIIQLVALRAPEHR